MPLSFNLPSAEQQLRQAIRKMVNFLLDNPSDENYYNRLYLEIDKLSIKAKTEGLSGYEHRNPHKKLTNFLNSGDISELVIKYYSVPRLYRKLIKQPKTEKILIGGRKTLEWVFDQISKIGRIFKIL